MSIHCTSQSDFIENQYNSHWRYYIVAAKAGHETLRVRKLIRTSRSTTSCYILKCNSTSRAQCASLALPNTRHFTHMIAPEVSQFDIVRQDDTDCFYIFGMTASDFNSAYQLSVTKQNNLLLLQSGISVSDHVEGGGGFDFFYFVPNFMATTTIRLTIKFGDADLYVSTTRLRPGPGNRCG